MCELTVDKEQRSTQQQGPMMKYGWGVGGETAGSLTPARPLAHSRPFTSPGLSFPIYEMKPMDPVFSFGLLLLCLHMCSPEAFTWYLYPPHHVAIGA